MVCLPTAVEVDAGVGGGDGDGGPGLWRQGTAAIVGSLIGQPVPSMCT